jgi:hypothetical protein
VEKGNLGYLGIDGRMAFRAYLGDKLLNTVSEGGKV